MLSPRWFRTLVLAGLLQISPAGAEVTLTHVHGLAYSADGKQLFVPSHHGLAIYADGRWSKAPGPQHDYMGFSGTRKYFYSSGHPAPGSGLVNPFGLMRSGDGGRTWDKLGLEGESDFHVLAAGYESNAVYVYNAAPNSRMDRPGIYSTLSNGFGWQRAQATGLAGKIASLAVHPTDTKRVAAATESGIFLSADAGASFAQIVGEEQGLAVHFDLDGKHLWASGHGRAATLRRIAMNDRRNETMPLPPLARDAVAYITQNPARRDEYAIATFERSVYLSADGGKSWKQIADRGRGL